MVIFEHKEVGFVRVLVLVVLLAACNNSPTKKKDDLPAKDWALVPFVKADEVNPILVPDTNATFNCPIIGKVKWEAKDVFNPAAVVRHDTIFLLYRAEDEVGKHAGTSRIGLAWSLDGLHFTKHPVPVLYPDNDPLKQLEWEGGCEDPRVVEDDKGTYYMTYTAYDGDKARLMIATSTDLYRWKKHGAPFVGPGGWSKSGSIISSYRNGTPVAEKVDGKYWMYFGDTDIFAATSDDLIHWTTVNDSTGAFISFIRPRKGKFDSDLVEPGPPAMITDSGIVLMYNSRNVRSIGDTTLAEHTYAASQILFDKNDPSRELKRMETYFIKPDKPYEISGQVNQVCFIEGLINFRDKWFLYYGTADSKIAVAVHEGPKL